MSCSVAEMFISKIVSETKLGKRYACLNGKGPFSALPLSPLQHQLKPCFVATHPKKACREVVGRNLRELKVSKERAKSKVNWK